jgi:hypothetical protein
MLSKRLVNLIEDHAEGLTRSVLADLLSNPRTQALHKASHDELRRRVYDAFHNLGRWLADRTEETFERTYAEMGRKRFGDRIPISQVVYGFIVMKVHLRDFIRASGLVDTAVDLYQEEELHLLVDQFFDKATYYAVRGYEEAAEAAVPRRAAG